jgi:hypothetical protein
MRRKDKTEKRQIERENVESLFFRFSLSLVFILAGRKAMRRKDGNEVA